MEAMRKTIAPILQGIERHNPNNLPTLEEYVRVQAQENGYDLEANLAVLNIYQFSQKYNLEITAQIMLKALTNFPHSDFVLCKSLLNERLCREYPFDQILNLADLLECNNFPQFWMQTATFPELHSKIQGFLDSIRKFVCHIVNISFQSIPKYLLCELLNLEITDSQLKYWIKSYGWKEKSGGIIFVANQDESIKTKNISEDISFDTISTILPLL